MNTNSDETTASGNDGADNASGNLIDQVLAGNREAFNELVRRHESHVYRTCLAITGNAHDAEDVLQDSFLNAFRNLNHFRRESTFRTWLTRIAINESLRCLRKHRPSVSLDDPTETEDEWLPKKVGDWGPNPEQSLMAGELRQILEKAVLALPAPYRIVFVLRDICQHSTAEVATLLDLKVPAVKSRLLRARLRVREHLAERFTKKRRLREMFSHAREALGQLADRFCRSIGLKR